MQFGSSLSMPGLLAQILSCSARFYGCSVYHCTVFTFFFSSTHPGNISKTASTDIIRYFFNSSPLIDVATGFLQHRLLGVDSIRVILEHAWVVGADFELFGPFLRVFGVPLNSFDFLLRFLVAGRHKGESGDQNSRECFPHEYSPSCVMKIIIGILIIFSSRLGVLPCNGKWATSGLGNGLGHQRGQRCRRADARSVGGLLRAARFIHCPREC